MLVPLGKILPSHRYHHPLTLPPQGLNCLPKFRIVCRRRKNALNTIRRSGPEAAHRHQVRGKPTSKPRTPEHFTDTVVAPAASDCCAHTGHKRGKYHTCLIVVSSKLAQIEIQLRLGKPRLNRARYGFQLVQRGKYFRRSPS